MCWITRTAPGPVETLLPGVVPEDPVVSSGPVRPSGYTIRPCSPVRGKITECPSDRLGGNPPRMCVRRAGKSVYGPTSISCPQLGRTTVYPIGPDLGSQFLRNCTGPPHEWH